MELLLEEMTPIEKLTISTANVRLAARS